MTIMEYCEKDLQARGLFESQAKEIMETVLLDSKTNPQSTNAVISGRWNDAIENYPEEARATISMGIRPFARRYIEEKCPMAWFRPMFE